MRRIRDQYGHESADALAAAYGVRPVTIWRIVGGQRAGEMRRATPDGMPIGAVLRQYRRQRGLSQDQLAAHLGIAPKRITAWESDAQLSRYWRWVCDALDLLPRPAPARVYGHGQILHDWRRAWGLTLAALGSHLYLTSERVRQWEYGLSPIPGRVCDLLEMPVDVAVSDAMRARPKQERLTPPLRGRQRVSRAAPGHGSRPDSLSRLPREEGEQWRRIPDARRYAVSTHGRVATLRRRPIATGLLLPSSNGQVVIRTDDGVARHQSVTRLVLLAFVGPPPTPEARPAMRQRGKDAARNRHLDNLYWHTLLEPEIAGR